MARRLLLLLLLSSCEGSFTGGTTGPGGLTPGAGGGGPNVSPATGGGLGGGGGGASTTPIVVPPRFSCTLPDARGTTFPTLRRLTRSELVATWTALVGPTVAGDTMVAATLGGLPSDELESLSTVNDAVPATWASTLAAASKRSSTLLLANASERARLLGACTAVTPITDACIRQVITGWGARVWRRDLDTSEVQTLADFATQVGGGEAGLGFVVRRLLQSPSLVFHLETRGTASNGRVRLTSFEVASRVAYLATGSMPDDALLTAARTGQLETSADVRAQLSRLLDTPGGHARIRDFMRYYLRLGNVSPPYGPLASLRQLDTAGLGDELRTEALDFAEGIFFDSSDGTFRQLMTSPRAMAKSDRVARIFGQSCAGVQSTPFAWNDARAFFAPDASGPGAAVQQITAPGWFVWQFPAGVLPRATKLEIEFAVTSPDSAEVTFDLNLDDVPTQTGVRSNGSLIITQARAVPAGGALKIGVHLANVTTARTVRVVGLRVIDAAGSACQPPLMAPSHPGLLHRPALLVGTAERTSPILRGAHVRKLFLCTELSTPDPALVSARQTEVGDLDALTNRERVTRLTDSPSCMGCHVMVNPLGFPFEAFDQAGMRRPVEQRFDAQGQPASTMAIDLRVDRPLLDFSGGGPTSLTDSSELVNALANSVQARACFTQRTFEYFHRSALDAAKDGCALAEAEQLAGAGTLRDVVLQLLSSDDLFYRPAGGTP
ncbi:MAG: DUF1588 domain-containing protein [Archangium sp.]